MAKIIHVSNFGRKPKGAFQHNVGHKISNGLIRNGHFVSNFSDRDVARSGSWIGHRKFGVAAANKALRAFCRSVEPHLVLLGHADVIQSETLAVIREENPSVRIAQWNVDPIFEPDNIARIRSKLAVVDATFVSTAGAALAPLVSTGDRYLGFLPNPVDFSVESGRNDLKAELPYDLFYPCGNPSATRFVCGQDWLPPDLCDTIDARIPRLRTLLPGMRGMPNLAGGAYQTALESAAIGLNLSRRNDVYLYSSDRLAHMCGNGMAVLMDRATGYESLIGPQAFAYFSSIDELAAQVERLKSDTSYRQKVACEGRACYHRLFNEQTIARYIMDAAFDKLRETDYAWPTRYRPVVA